MQEPDPHPAVRLRPDLIGLAYRMTGSYATAEDIAQEAFLRWSMARQDDILQPRAWLLRVTTRLALDHLRSAHHRRERYVGPWLPEPVPDTDEPPQLLAHREAQDLSVAFLLTLQRLSPAERAAFILHDLFEMPFAELAGLLGRSETACRKLASRARARLGGDREGGPPPLPTDTVAAERLAQAFFRAARAGDEAALRTLLAADVAVHTDGGGIRPAARNLILGREKAARFFLGLARKTPVGEVSLLHIGRINGLPGFITREPDGLVQTTALEVAAGRICAIYIVRNPEKLERIETMFPRGSA